MKTVKCKICNDTKMVEVYVMGADTEFVECSYCSNKPEYEKFQNWVNNNNIEYNI